MKNLTRILDSLEKRGYSRRMVLFHVLFHSTHLVIFLIGVVKQLKSDADYFNSLGASAIMSRSAGFVLAFDCSILLIGVCRNLITILRQSFINKYVPFEENIYFHKWIAYAVLFFSVIHTNAHITNAFLFQYQAPDLPNKEKQSPGTAKNIHFESFAGITGYIMLLCCFLMYTSAKREVKTKNFEFFWYTHHLFIPFYLALFFHASGCLVKNREGVCRGLNSHMATIPFFVFYLLERIYRHYRGSLQTQLTKVIFHPGNTVELRFEKSSFHYKPGQYLFLNIPEVSLLQWHPFTISSTPEEGFVSVHIRIVGDWTRSVADIMGCFNTSSSEIECKMPKIVVDGPYGTAAEDLYNYRVAVIIGAGIGVTPAAALLKSVWYRYYRKAPMPLEKVYFFWINREMQAFSWFQSLLSSLEKTVPISKLEIHTYLTGHQSIEDIQNIALNLNDAVDEITELKTKTHYGRPDWCRIFKSIHSQSRSRRNMASGGPLDIGVFYCGPKPLAKQLGEKCLQASDANIMFTLRKEHF